MPIDRHRDEIQSALISSLILRKSLRVGTNQRYVYCLKGGSISTEPIIAYVYPVVQPQGCMKTGAGNNDRYVNIYFKCWSNKTNFLGK